MEWLLFNYVVDIWTIIHFMFWGSLVFIFPKKTPNWQIIFLLVLIGFAWEVVETNLEDILQRRWREPFLNRWVSDPIVDTLGTLVYLWRRKVLLRKE